MARRPTIQEQNENRDGLAALNMIGDVAEFHRCFGHPILDRPDMPPMDRQKGRKHMLEEEFKEGINLLDAPTQAGPDGIKQLAEIGDWFADLIYYAIGGALEYGIPLAAIWEEVQRANMSKLWTDEEIADTLPGPDGVEEVQKHHRLEFVASTYTGWTASRASDNLVTSFMAATQRQWTVKDSTGKVRKPPSWKEPDVVGIIARAMHPETEWSKTATAAEASEREYKADRGTPSSPSSQRAPSTSVSDGCPPDIANNIDRGPVVQDGHGFGHTESPPPKPLSPGQQPADNLWGM